MTEDFRSFIERFTYMKPAKDDKKQSGLRPKTRTKATRSQQIKKRESLKHSNSKVLQYPLDHALPDIIDHNLLVLFVGINPGIKSSQRGHHFAGPTNHFYPCLVESGLTNNEVVNYENDIELPTKFRIGLINVCSRTTRSSADLNKSEIMDGIPSLVNKVKLYRPKILSFVGKCAYEAYEKSCQDSNINDGKKSSFKFGLQSKKIFWADGGYTKISAMPSTSGRVAHYQKDYKLKLFKELKTLVDIEREQEVTNQLYQF
ncbi:uracil-DNA glycosylase-like protein [Glomus cerebriforme]|uniref:G/T mismatch-specific thymine DNA glycosylase n=1 Tax=Glomus cerebriforme TaxID=658196 RepID=A0A397TG55_9GLOM|nr:uracil-DNA glycosylase-like protein [Glomus cerebriforme]